MEPIKLSEADVKYIEKWVPEETLKRARGKIQVTWFESFYPKKESYHVLDIVYRVPGEDHGYTTGGRVPLRAFRGLKLGKWYSFRVLGLSTVKFDELEDLPEDLTNHYSGSSRKVPFDSGFDHFVRRLAIKEISRCVGEKPIVTTVPPLDIACAYIESCSFNRNSWECKVGVTRTYKGYDIFCTLSGKSTYNKNYEYYPLVDEVDTKIELEDRYE